MPSASQGARKKRKRRRASPCLPFAPSRSPSPADGSRIRAAAESGGAPCTYWLLHVHHGRLGDLSQPAKEILRVLRDWARLEGVTSPRLQWQQAAVTAAAKKLSGCDKVDAASGVACVCVWKRARCDGVGAARHFSIPFGGGFVGSLPCSSFLSLENCDEPHLRRWHLAPNKSSLPGPGIKLAGEQARRAPSSLSPSLFLAFSRGQQRRRRRRRRSVGARRLSAFFHRSYRQAGHVADAGGSSL
ncbi:hypothetical protein HPB50_005887 [Hyalomma asiaticum]|uniref:Uncharacterized protein n=1 Tax=Hyalomma asiaticum TaxID=266040 RepID=A0ACB7S4Z3_HYAAI|nr:hypothetical protein HPB50_005887 [Hyalomma asiaticum]